MKYKYTASLSIVVFSVIVLSACLPTMQAQPEMAPAQEAQVLEENTDAVVEENNNIVLSAEVEGQTAFELLQANHEVEAEQFDFGVFIKSIDGLAGSDDYYWALYVNEEYAQQGADQTVLTVGDTVEFRYEEVTY